jgi:hypothetical protein
LPAKRPLAIPSGPIARKLGVPIRRVEAAIKALGLEPAFQAGALKLYHPQDVARIEAELARTRFRSVS